MCISYKVYWTSSIYQLIFDFTFFKHDDHLVENPHLKIGFMVVLE